MIAILSLFLSSFFPLLPPCLLSLSLSTLLPCYESWLSSQPIPLAVIRGFGFQPACISRPGGFGKTSRVFQSNKERRVSVIQIWEASKRMSCTQLLWWITKTKRNIKSEEKKRASWLNESQHSPWRQEDEQLGGTATCLGCHLLILLLNFCSLYHFFLTINCPDVFVVGTSFIFPYVWLPDVLICAVDKP